MVDEAPQREPIGKTSYPTEPTHTVSHSKIEEFRSRARQVSALLASLRVLGGMPVLWRQGGGGAPVLRPSLAGHRCRLACRSAIHTVVACKRCGDREWGLRPGAPPPPCEPSVAHRRVVCRPGAGPPALSPRRHAGTHAFTPAGSQRRTSPTGRLRSVDSYRLNLDSSVSRWARPLESA